MGHDRENAYLDHRQLDPETNDGQGVTVQMGECSIHQQLLDILKVSDNTPWKCPKRLKPK